MGAAMSRMGTKRSGSSTQRPSKLHRVRAALVEEIRADEDERAARIEPYARRVPGSTAGDIPDDEQRPSNGGRRCLQ
jgi:hypothetical protein